MELALLIWLFLGGLLLGVSLIGGSISRLLRKSKAHKRHPKAFRGKNKLARSH